jgi:hypothetical protein
MKKLLLRLVGFVCFSLAFYVVGVIVWGSFLPQRIRPNIHYAKGAFGFMHTRLKELDTVGGVDLLILGSSHAYRGFDTRIFQAHGIRAFNLGSSGQTPIQTLQLLRQYMDRLTPAKVLIEVNPITLSADGVESGLDLVANGKIDIHTLKMVQNINQVSLYNSFLLSAYWKLTGFDKGFREPLKIGYDMYVGGGYVERTLGYYRAAPLSGSMLQFNVQQLEALRLCRMEIEKRNSQLLLVFAPVSKHLYTTYLNIDTMDAAMKQLGDYYNFNGQLSLVDSLHFYDADHLNQLGVEIFNKKMIPALNFRRKL